MQWSIYIICKIAPLQIHLHSMLGPAIDRLCFGLRGL